ncbi:Hypothetical predicted protein, partial [Olea europaea subsp. europaea]
SAQSDTEGSSQIEVYQKEPFHRSSDDLVGLVERTEDDGFVPVIRKRHPLATDTPFLSRRITRNVVPPPVQPLITRTDKGKAAPSVLPTTTTIVVIESVSTSVVPTSTPITVDPEVPPFIHSFAEPTPKVPIEVPISHIIISTAPILTATTEAPLEPTQINSPPLKTCRDGTQSAQGSGTRTIPYTTFAQGLLAEISSERHGVKHMLIDHFRKDHGMKVGSTMRFAIKDLVFKLFVSDRPGLPQAEQSLWKSFASIIQGTDDSSTVGFASKEPFTHMGKPVVVLTESEESILSDPYKFTLVGKFPHRKPTMRKVPEIFSKFGFQGFFE